MIDQNSSDGTRKPPRTRKVSRSYGQMPPSVKTLVLGHRRRKLAEGELYRALVDDGVPHFAALVIEALREGLEEQEGRIAQMERKT